MENEARVKNVTDLEVFLYETAAKAASTLMNELVGYKNGEADRLKITAGSIVEALTLHTYSGNFYFYLTSSYPSSVGDKMYTYIEQHKAARRAFLNNIKGGPIPHAKIVSLASSTLVQTASLIRELNPIAKEIGAHDD